MYDAAGALGGAVTGGLVGAGVDEENRLRGGLIGAVGGAAAGYKARKMYSAAKHRKMFREGRAIIDILKEVP